MNVTLRRLIQLAWPIRNWMLLAALLGSFTVMSGIGLLTTSGYLISAAALHPSVAVLQVAIVGVRFFGISRGIFRYVERLVSHRATFRLLAKLRVWFYSALEPLIPARLLEQKDGQLYELRSGDMLRRAVSDIDTLQNFYVRVLAPPLVAVIIGIVMWIFFGFFGVVFGLIFIAFYIISSIIIPWLAHILGRRVNRELVATQAELETHLVDSVQGIADLIAFGQEEREAQHIQSLNKKLQKLQMTNSYVSGMQGTLTNLMMNLSGWTMLLVAIPYVYRGQFSGILLAVLVMGALASFEGILPLASSFQQLGGSLEAARRLFEIVDAKPTINNPAAPSPTADNQTIQAEHLSFRYAANEPYVLIDINFTLQQGKCLMVIGPSGSGKSTLAHLLLRFWDYQEGLVTIGGHPLSEYQQDDLYKLVSVVEQDTHLFNTSIRDNLMIARSEASDEEMVEAAKQAQLHDFIQTLPDGYDTQVGEQGLRLSGGERQRVAIARAFLKDTPILILDEPTVNLDPITERAVLGAINKLRQHRTTFMVTHRLAEMDMADEIVVLQDGKIVERGTHVTLLQTEGLYWRMWQQQRSQAAISS